MKVYALHVTQDNEPVCFNYLRKAEPHEKKGIVWIDTAQYYRVLADNFDEAYEIIKRELYEQR